MSRAIRTILFALSLLLTARVSYIGFEVLKMAQASNEKMIKYVNELKDENSEQNQDANTKANTTTENPEQATTIQ